MGEYELYTRILSPIIKPTNQKVLIEKEANHKATVDDGNCVTYTIYRYDQDTYKELFFPFFNKAHNDDDKGVIVDNPTPDDLLSFCDYIIIAERKEKLYVILVEMKSGGTGGASKQIDASSTFMNYIKNSAIRVAHSNAYEDFDENKIIERSVILIKPNRNEPRLLTNIAKSKNYYQYPDFKSRYAKLISKTLPLRSICE